MTDAGYPIIEFTHFESGVNKQFNTTFRGDSIVDGFLKLNDKHI